MNTPLNQLKHFEATQRLTQIVQEAYHRRSRQLPANLTEIVATLKGDLLKRMPSVGIETIDEAVTHETLNRIDVPLSPAFLYDAIKRHYTPPMQPRDMDAADLTYWRNRLRDIENRGGTGSRQAEEARWWINKLTTGDSEWDTVSLLDTLAPDAAQGRPAHFNPWREYAYLVMRGQFPLEHCETYEQQARNAINMERVRDFKRPLAQWTGADLDDLNARTRHLAVVGWLKSVADSGRKPSDILTPLINENQYKQFRRTL